MTAALVATEIEQQLVTACEAGRELSLQSDDVLKNASSSGDSWPPSREIRAEFIVQLLANAPGPILNLKGCRITGSLNLAGREVKVPVVLSHCWFERPLMMHHAHTKGFHFMNSWFRSLVGNAWVVGGDLELSGVICTGNISLVDAIVSGTLYFDGSRLIRDIKSADQTVLNCNRIKVHKAVRLGGGFVAHGAVTFIDGEIGNSFEAFNGCALFGSPRAFQAHRLRLGGALLFSDRIELAGDMQLGGAIVHGPCLLKDVGGKRTAANNPQLLTTSSSVAEAQSGNALVQQDHGLAFNGTFLQVDGNLSFDSVSLGVVRLGAATIGSLDWRTVSLSGVEQICVELTGARIKNYLAIKGSCVFKGRLVLTACHVERSCEIRESEIQTNGGVAIAADSFGVGDHLLLGPKLKVGGEIKLVRASIGLSCTISADIDSKERNALTLDEARLGSNLVLAAGTHISGSMSWQRLNVAGEMIIDDVAIVVAKGVAINGFRMKVGSAVRMYRSAIDGGSATFQSAQVDGYVLIEQVRFQPHTASIDLRKAQLRAGFAIARCATLPAINMVGAEIGGDVQVVGALGAESNAFSIDVSRATIAGDLVLDQLLGIQGRIVGNALELSGSFKASFLSVSEEGRVTGTSCVDLTRAVIQGDVTLDGTTIEGGLSLVDAKIGRSVSLAAATISREFASSATDHSDAEKDQGDGPLGVDLASAAIQGDLNLAAATITGGLGLADAKIGRDVNLVNVIITRQVTYPALGQGSLRDVHGLLAPGLTVGGQLLLIGATIDSSVVLFRSRIEGDLDCRDASFGPAAPILFDASEVMVAGTFIWHSVQLKGQIELRGARVASLSDSLASWPKNSYSITDFEFKSVTDEAIPDDQRLGWLQNQHPWSRQPYEFAARWLKLRGREKDAKAVQRSRRSDERKFGDLSLPGKIWNHVLDAFAGHGYQMWRIPLWALLIIFIGSGVFYLADTQHVMVMVKAAEMSATTATSASTVKRLNRWDLDYPQFDAFTYSLDSFLPVVDLHQESHYLPVGGKPGRIWFESYLRIHILFGWLMTTLTVATLGGLGKRD